MATAYFLILMFSNPLSHAGGMTAVKFNSLTACERAGNEFKNIAPMTAKHKFLCIKGD